MKGSQKTWSYNATTGSVMLNWSPDTVARGCSFTYRTCGQQGSSNTLSSILQHYLTPKLQQLEYIVLEVLECMSFYVLLPVVQHNLLQKFNNCARHQLRRSTHGPQPIMFLLSFYSHYSIVLKRSTSHNEKEYCIIKEPASCAGQTRRCAEGLGVVVSLHQQQHKLKHQLALDVRYAPTLSPYANVLRPPVSHPGCDSPAPRHQRRPQR